MQAQGGPSEADAEMEVSGRRAARDGAGDGHRAREEEEAGVGRGGG